MGEVAAGVLKENQKKPGFINTDPRGQKLPEYLEQLSAHLAVQQGMLQQRTELTVGER
ncbi:MAG: hypothetical protein M2R45_00782 [Verrucomicrobia subdivision 3 bacterium]|nr:hypothetical protein [Limisphaerales bacterium]MCS1413113.1 hypothetical protein [Limisphaerales bacterium]